MKSLIKSSVLLLFIAGTATIYAGTAPPHPLPAGMGRYILVLKIAGERRDTPKAITEPDVAKLGGKVISKHDNRRVIELPAAAAKNLRADENVAYLQRVWMGEPLDTWDERDLAAGGASALKAHADDVTGSNLTWDSGAFAYDSSGNIKAIGDDRYAYDTASRLVNAVVGGQTETYGYDSFGNLTQKTLAGSSSAMPPIDSTSNRISGETYDAAGNVTTNGSRIGYVFDSAGSMMELDTNYGQRRRMIYTAEDERIADMLDSQLVRWKVRDFNTGQILREFQSDGSAFGDPWEWTEDYVYAGSTVVGAEMEDYYGGRRHFHLDHLGSVRMITNDSRMRYSRNDYYPFGGEQSSSVQEATNFGFWRSDPAKFTGHEREYYGVLNVDNSDYLDYMHARYYNPNMGRFLSVDPIIPTAAAQSPQRWNRYAYVGNNPVLNTDPTGKLLKAGSGQCDDKKPCYSKMDAFQAVKNWVGADAAQKLVIGKNGQITLAKGVSFSQFAKMGPAAAIVANLMRSTDRTATIALSSDVKDDSGRSTSAVTSPVEGGTLSEINPAMFPSEDGGVLQTMDTAMAHELGGHGLMDMWGVSPFDKSYGSIDLRFSFVKLGEAFAVTMENRYRAAQGMDIRTYYLHKFDYDPPPGAPRP